LYYSKSNSDTNNQSYTKDENQNTNTINNISKENESNISFDEEDEKIEEKKSPQQKV
jgi:hypothetical protein